MNNVISQHLQKKGYLLLNSFLPFKSKNKSLLYDNYNYSNFERTDYFCIEIYLKHQDLIFNFSPSRKIIDIKIEDRNGNNRNFSYLFNKFMPGFMYNDRSVYYSIKPDLIEYEYEGPFKFELEITRKGKLHSINISHERLILHILEDKISTNLFGTFKIIDVSDSVVKEIKEKTKNYIILEVHSDKSIKKLGMTLDGKREGFYYESDELGNFEISCYINDKLHGHYFNSKTKEEGFYEEGVKVGFWEEQDKIVNYDKNEISGRDRIFFISPVFLF